MELVLQGATIDELCEDTGYRTDSSTSMIIGKTRPDSPKIDFGQVDALYSILIEPNCFMLVPKTSCTMSQTSGCITMAM